MTEAPDISETVIRQHVLARAEAYCRAHKASFSSIGLNAVGDDRFLARVKAGDNFTVKTLQRVLDWLDEAEKADAA